jgi:hypothetical protein
MKTVLMIGGWFLAGVFLMVSGYLYFEMSSAEVNARRAEAAAVGERDTTRSENQDLKKRLEEALAEAASLREQLQAAPQAVAGTEAAGVAPANPVKVPEAADTAAETPAPPETDAQSQAERIAEAQMAIIADMAYKDLYDELQVPEDIRSQIRSSIAAHLIQKQQATVAAMMARKQTAKEVYAENEARDAELRQQLAAFLTPEELAAWDEYEPVADQIMYERLVEGQLNMLASGLNAENRTLASQVVAEELVREFDLFNASETLYTQDNFNDAQARALNASLDRLSGTVDADQYALVEGFVNQALTMFEAMSEQDATP